MFAYPLPRSDERAGFVVVSDRFLCLLGEEADAALARQVYAWCEQSHSDLAGLLIDVLDQAGLSRFAVVEIVSAEHRNMHVAVRGDITVDIAGSASTRLLGPTGASWVIGEAHGVTSIRLALDASAVPGELVPLRRGVGRASAIMVDPAAARHPVAETDASDSEWELITPDGERYHTSVPIVFGRRPETDVTGADSTVQVVVPSPRREISALHLELRRDGETLQARDLTSTNGTVLRSSGKPPRLLHTGKVTALRGGDTLDLGEGFVVTVQGRH